MKYKFSGHQTFVCRYGWLEKGVRLIQRNPHGFLEDDVLIQLGVGKNMVESIKYWCVQTGLLVDNTFMQFLSVTAASFLLALKPNRNLIKGHFVANTLKSTLPSGIAMFLSVAMTYAFMNVLGIADNAEQISTVAMFSMTVTGVLALWILLFPYDLINLGIGILGTVGTVGCYLVFPWALGLIASWTGGEEPTPMFVSIDGNAILFIALNALVMAALIVCGKLIMHTIEKRKLSKTLKEA